MSKIKLLSQDEIAETLLTALYQRANEASRPDALLCDETARRLVEQIDYDFNRFTLNEMDQVTTILRVRQFDRFAQDFLSRHPSPVVVNLGCGLDTRFERVDNGLVEWYNLDLPEVIEFRRKLMADTRRSPSLGCSIFDQAWLKQVGYQPTKSYLFIAEGVFPYFTEEQVKSLFMLFMGEYPGCELVCDGMSPLMIRIHNLELSRSKVTARLGWALKNGRQPESWAPGIHMLSDWYYFDRPEQRLGTYQLMRYIPAFAKGVGIYHYQLGIPAQ
jgi:O-methyltransferase involved in polyketide biosynthesis